MFDDFDEIGISRDGVRVLVRSGGSGSPVVFLHGYPESHHMWAEVAGEVARDRTAVVMDLRGYGSSDAPAPSADDANYSKREMALDVVHVMTELGHRRFDVVGHDRGGRVAHRLGLDHPDRVVSIAVLDIVPTLHMFEAVDREMAEAYFHWFFLTRPAGLPERLIGADPDFWITSRFEGRRAEGAGPDEQRIEHYRRAFRRPEVVAATCADYRAAASIDLLHDRADRDAGRRLACPLLALWGRHSYVGTSFDVLEVWSGFADRVSGSAVDADHYLAEENPDATVDALRQFWADVA